MANLIKLVLVDLDNTLWDGVLLEDGLEKLRLNNLFVDRLRQLDKIGVLLAIVSKNYSIDVEEALAHFGVSDLFIANESSFDPKSANVHTILRFVRFDPAVCLFVDDSAYEREEVVHAFPEIRAISPDDFLNFGCGTEAWAVASSWEEGRIRKKSYIEDGIRRSAETTYSGTFRQFLRQSGLLLKIAPPSEQSIARISELAQRTNQSNFSTNRYTQTEIRQLLNSPLHKTFIATASDRYGMYGMIGFASLRLEKKQAVIQDLMLSCRIQGKGVESAMISVLAEKAKAAGMERLMGLYRPTRRNGQISGVFQMLGFTATGEEGEYQQFEISLYNSHLPRPSHVRIVVSDSPIIDEDVGIPFIRHIVKSCINQKIIGGNILDIGAGWDGVLGTNCDRFLLVDGNKHVRLDMEQYPHTDIVADGQKMSLIDDETFDSALCLEVLEHCTDPFLLCKELIRILRIGGTAIVSAPMNFPIHDTPADYWRFTPDGLKRLFWGKASLVHEYVEGENDHPIRTVLVMRKDAILSDYTIDKDSR